jgi:hypothetical protein
MWRYLVKAGDPRFSELNFGCGTRGISRSASRLTTFELVAGSFPVSRTRAQRNDDHLPL